MQLMMAYLTQRQQILKCVLAPVFAEEYMVSFKPNVFLPTLLTSVAVAHQASKTQIFIKSRGILISRSAQGRIIEASNIYLNIFYSNGCNGTRDLPHHANDFLHIGFNRRRKSPTLLT